MEYPRKTFLNKFVAINYDKCQALRNKPLSNVRSHSPVLQNLFVNILSYQNICTCWLSRKYLTCFFVIILFFCQAQYVYGFSHFSLIFCMDICIHVLCLQYAWKKELYIKVGTYVVWQPKHLFAIFLIKNHFFNCFFSYLFFPEKLMFSHMGSFLECTGIPQTQTTLAINNMSLFCS